MTSSGDRLDPNSQLDIGAWADRFRLLGDPTRLRLLTAMHQAGPGTASVGELAAAAGISDATASQALRTLRLQGWVRDEREGRTVRYTLTDRTVHDLLHLIGAGHGTAPAQGEGGAPGPGPADGAPGERSRAT
ncbi:ArsR/SmtB family transcription factor [Nocardiopsis sp. NPDC101807]|uniref:ArsR/SmtB family transcription factor n=1 Tax=Nocardiopsis sp. NPDC101807 TaxID=3364339 RepID=UPI003813F64F